MNAAALRRLAVSRRAFAVARPIQQRAYSDSTKDPQLGDYPEVPPVNRNYMSPRGWWDNQMRRNFGDLPHPEDELYSMWAPDPPTVRPSRSLFEFSLAASLFGAVMLFAYKVTPERSAVPRQYPFDGLVQDLGGLEENKARPEALEEEEDE